VAAIDDAQARRIFTGGVLNLLAARWAFPRHDGQDDPL
jgi:hypothetical protein